MLRSACATIRDMASQRFHAIGLMSGTSMDGVDAAFLETDGEAHVVAGPHLGMPYPEPLRSVLLGLPGKGRDVAGPERELTDLQIEAVRRLCADHGIDPRVDVVGFHGQTILHDPAKRRSWQLGDGQRMADALGLPVVNGFRQNDLDHGGQGAPFAPVYHQALVRAGSIPEPVAILNIGGVSNLTLVDGELLFACDCGPGNALIDDWVRAHCGVPYDEGGRIAASGRIDHRALERLLNSPHFSRHGPKSLDRNAFSVEPVRGLSPQDGTATLTAFTAAAVAAEARRFPRQPREWIVVGGGRLNGYLLSALRQRLRAPVRPAEELGWAGQAIEAQAFAYLAVRSLLQLPLSFPGTTGVREPVSGGVCWRPLTPPGAGTSAGH